MFKKSPHLNFTLFFTLFALGGIAFSKPVPAAEGDMDLIGTLTQKLGVTKDQASGGAGSIFNLAKEKLSATDFSTVSEKLPEIDGLMASAPKADGLKGKLGGMSSMLGGGEKSAGGLASLAGSFSSLGLAPDMVGKFVPVALDYAKGTGGDQVMNLLKGALK